MKDAWTKNGKRLDSARYGKLEFNKNKMCGKTIHKLDDLCSEMDTAEIERFYGFLVTTRI